MLIIIAKSSDLHKSSKAGADHNFSLFCVFESCFNHFITFGAFNSYVYQTHRSVLGLDIANKDNMEETILLLL